MLLLLLLFLLMLLLLLMMVQPWIIHIIGGLFEYLVILYIRLLHTYYIRCTFKQYTVLVIIVLLILLLLLLVHLMMTLLRVPFFIICLRSFPHVFILLFFFVVFFCCFLLATRSYVTGYSMSADDSKALSNLKLFPCANKQPHAYRWARHISALTGRYLYLYTSVHIYVYILIHVYIYLCNSYLQENPIQAI